MGSAWGPVHTTLCYAGARSSVPMPDGTSQLLTPPCNKAIRKVTEHLPKLKADRETPFKNVPLHRPALNLVLKGGLSMKFGYFVPTTITQHSVPSS